MNDKLYVEFKRFVPFPHPNGGKHDVLKRHVTVEDEGKVFVGMNGLNFENDDGSHVLVPFSNINYIQVPAEWTFEGQAL